MKKSLTIATVIFMLLALFIPTTNAKGIQFDYEKRKVELKQEREDLYNWYVNCIVESLENIRREHGNDALLLVPTPGASEKYVTRFRTFTNGYMLSNPAPESIFYEDEFYEGYISIVDVKTRHIIPVTTEFFVTYGGYVQLKSMYNNFPKDELQSMMSEYYKNKLSEPTFESEIR